MTTTFCTPTPRSRRSPGKIGIHQPKIEGLFRRITAHQITMAWWLHVSGHVSRRQLRVYFAAHEMHEQRKYTYPDEHNRARSSSTPRTHALYRVEEIAAMVLGQGKGRTQPAADPQRALAGLRADIRHLARLGLVAIEAHSITFAVSIDQIRLQGADDISGFWTMFEQIPNARRTVPVPRRTLRALAGVGGLSRGVTGVMLAMLIRSLFWHKQSASYRVDGRTKASWIVQVFGLSRRSVTDARATLIELGWIEDLEPPQWAMNRWGSHDRINPDWAPTQPSPRQSLSPTAQPTNRFNQAANQVSTPAAVGGLRGGGSHGASTPQTTRSTYTGFASPQAQNDIESASPCLHQNTLPKKGDLKTRRLEGKPPSPSGVSLRNGVGKKTTDTTEGAKSGSRKKKLPWRAVRRAGRGRNTPNTPNIRDIQIGHMLETADLLELYRQATAIGLAKPSEAGRLDFLALAEHAKAHGKRAGAMFFWLLREKKSAFITLSDEDTAVQRIRAIHNPDNTRSRQQERWRGGNGMRGSNPLATSGNQGQQDQSIQNTRGRGLEPLAAVNKQEEHFVLTCIRIAKQKRIEDPYRIAKIKDWTRERWDAALASYEARQWERLQRSHMQDLDENAHD